MNVETFRMMTPEKLHKRIDADLRAAFRLLVTRIGADEGSLWLEAYREDPRGTRNEQIATGTVTVKNPGFGDPNSPTGRMPSEIPIPNPRTWSPGPIGLVSHGPFEGYGEKTLR